MRRLVAIIVFALSLALPVWAQVNNPNSGSAVAQKAFSLNVQCFGMGCPSNTSTGTITYTPTTGMVVVHLMMQCPGGGAGGNTQGVGFTGGPGAPGTFTEVWFTAATIGSSQTGLIGGGGGGGSAGNNPGSAGGTTNFGTNSGANPFASCGPGNGGAGSTSATGTGATYPSAGSILNTISGIAGGVPGPYIVGQSGANAPGHWGGVQNVVTGNGAAPTFCGQGGLPGKDNNSSTRSGGAGGDACMVFEEYIFN